MTVDVTVALVACALLLAIGFCIGAWLAARLDRARVRKAHAHYDRHLDELRLEVGKLGEQIGALAPAPVGPPAMGFDAGAGPAAEQPAAVRSGALPIPPRSLAVDVPRDIEIPARLVGPETKAALEHFAPLMGVTPAELLRAAVMAGLSGGEPVIEPILRGLEPLLRDAFGLEERPDDEPN